MSGPTTDVIEHEILEEDVHTLHKMGYAQELARNMHAFSNFAISFSIICILAGGITSFQLGFSSAGGFSVGVGWLVGAAFAMVVAASMAQIASAYPTAGGLYHWASILGGRGWGWATAWINMLGLVFVVASVDVGVYLLAKSLIIQPMLGIDTADWGFWQQTIAVVGIAVTQGLFNHFGIRLTTRITDFSGYLIFAVAVALIVTMLSHVDHLEFGRLFTLVNNTGEAGGDIFPRTESAFMAFSLGLLLTLYTLTGFDASAHTSEETVDARRAVPKGMMNSVLWAALFGYAMTASFILAMPDPKASAAKGGDVFFDLLGGLGLPTWYQNLLYIGIVVANYVCGLACITSASRMFFAFARDGGLPAFLRHVDPTHRVPARAIWTAVVLTVAATLYSPAFAALAAGCAVFLYVSYAMPVVAGAFAEGRTWTEFGPFRLGALSKPFAAITGLGVVFLAYIGLQPPNDILVSYAVGAVVLLVGGWYLIERRRFQGPPIGEKAVAAKHDEIVAAEEAVHEEIHVD